MSLWYCTVIKRFKYRWPLSEGEVNGESYDKGEVGTECKVTEFRFNQQYSSYMVAVIISCLRCPNTYIHVY